MKYCTFTSRQIPKNSSVAFQLAKSFNQPKVGLTVHGTRSDQTASPSESCLRNSRSREFNLESQNDLLFFRPEFQLKNTFDPALRGVAGRLSF
ncbi:hypothetical protein AVEN_257657-1 [Araneus ventricosus]|uniref:Uncharacterized protein n=1 Tax=Araneus ventricosus TaxID=182803 RepID=A0A4Y2R9B9_ARAVE|nr:hypothetical protein AVEN_257657-1 [Araneus ventricosus]